MSSIRNNDFINNIQNLQSNEYLYEDNKQAIRFNKDTVSKSANKVSFLKIAIRIDEWYEKNKSDPNVSTDKILVQFKRMHSRKLAKVNQTNVCLRAIRNFLSKIQNLFSIGCKTSVQFGTDLIKKLESHPSSKKPNSSEVPAQSTQAVIPNQSQSEPLTPTPVLIPNKLQAVPTNATQAEPTQPTQLVTPNQPQGAKPTQALPNQSRAEPAQQTPVLIPNKSPFEPTQPVTPNQPQGAKPTQALPNLSTPMPPNATQAEPAQAAPVLIPNKSPAEPAQPTQPVTPNQSQGAKPTQALPVQSQAVPTNATQAEPAQATPVLIPNKSKAEPTLSIPILIPNKAEPAQPPQGVEPNPTQPTQVEPQKTPQEQIPNPTNANPSNQPVRPPLQPITIPREKIEITSHLVKIKSCIKKADYARAYKLALQHFYLNDINKMAFHDILIQIIKKLNAEKINIKLEADKLFENYEHSIPTHLRMYTDVGCKVNQNFMNDLKKAIKDEHKLDCEFENLILNFNEIKDKLTEKQLEKLDSFKSVFLGQLKDIKEVLNKKMQRDEVIKETLRPAILEFLAGRMGCSTREVLPKLLEKKGPGATTITDEELIKQVDSYNFKRLDEQAEEMIREPSKYTLADFEDIIKQSEKEARAYESLGLALLEKKIRSNIIYLAQCKWPEYLDDKSCETFVGKKAVDHKIELDFNDLAILRQMNHWIIQNTRDHRRIDDPQMVELKLKQSYPLAKPKYGRLKKQETLNKPNTPENMKLGQFTVATATSHGIRDYMEDRHVSKSFAIHGGKGSGKADTIPLFCVIDGHGGEACAQFLSENMVRLLQRSLLELPNFSKVTMWNFLKNHNNKVRKAWDDQVKLDTEKSGKKNKSGAALISAFIIDGMLYVASTGDSRAVLCDSNGQAVQLTEDAEFNAPNIREGIEKRGGIFDYSSNAERVHDIAMGRSLESSDSYAISARSCVSINDIREKKPKFLILACDGIWDVLSSEEVVKLGWEMVEKNKGVVNPAEIAAAIREKAHKEQFTQDNTTVMVIAL